MAIKRRPKQPIFELTVITLFISLFISLAAAVIVNQYQITATEYAIMTATRKQVRAEATAFALTQTAAPTFTGQAMRSATPTESAQPVPAATDAR